MSASAPELPVLVVGAGPVGLTAAASLLHHGVRCRIVDKAPAPTDKSKALVVWSRTMELLDGVGKELSDTFVKHGMKAAAASIYSGGERVVHVTIAGVESPFGYPLMIPQSETERLLTEHLAAQGVAVERSVELLTFTKEADRVVGTLKLADGTEEPFEASWLLGCDGAHSTVRKTLGVPFTGHAEPNDWMLADVHVDGPIAPDEITVFWHHSGVLVWFPIALGRFRVIADLGMAKTERRPPDPTIEEVQAMIDARGPGGIRVFDPIWLAGFRINERKISDYRHGRVVLAGDAAHIHSPAGGQGMNTGMQDAFNLAWKIALVLRGEGKEDVLLESYSKERSEVGDQVLHNAGFLTMMATLRNSAAQFVRNHVVGLAASFGFVQDRLKNTLAELSIGYRGGPISGQDWPWLGGGCAAGDRLPDAPLTAADGTPSSLHQAIRGVKHTLLLLAATKDAHAVPPLLAVAAEAENAFPGLLRPVVVLAAGGEAPFPTTGGDVWIDVAGEVRSKLGASAPSIVLVRPDGYIGFRGQPAEAAPLLAHLDKYLVRKAI